MTKITRFLAVLAATGVVTPVYADVTIDELIEQAGLVEGPVATRDLPRWQGANRIMIARVSPEDIAVLAELYPETEFIPVGPGGPDLAALADVDAIVGMCSGELVDAAPNLVWIQIAWAGAEGCLSVPRVGSGDIILTNMQKMSSPVIGEHAIALALAAARALPVYSKQMVDDDGREAMFEERVPMVPLAGKTMLVVGLGGIGTQVARKAHGLGMRVLATRGSRREGPEFVEYVGLSDETAALAAQADVVVNTVPLTDRTRGMFDAAFFAAMKPTAYYVSVGRGGTTVTDDLVAALEQGQLAGAGLDVTDPEPLPEGHPLWSVPRVIITPHVGGRSDRGRERLYLLVRENLRRYVAGEPMLSVVDIERGY